MIYFDNAASTSIDKEVLKSYVDFAGEYFANPASLHGLGLKCSEYESKARTLIASILKVKENEVIFTSGATEGNNLAIKGVAMKYKNRGKHIITSKIEHASVLEAFHFLERKMGFEVTYLDVDKYGLVSIDDLKKAIRPDTILVSIMAVNNEIGTIEPIKEIGSLLKDYPKIFFHSDITQAVGKINIDLTNIDLATLSLHKIHGFKGSGILIKKANISLEPLLHGGNQEYGFRSGTNNLPIEISAAKTLRLALNNQKKSYDKACLLRKHLIEKLNDVEGVELNSHESDSFSPFIVNFSIEKKASVVVEALSSKGIYVSTKSACSSKKSSLSYVLLSIGKSENIAKNAIRVSFCENNEIEEIDTFIKELKYVIGRIK